MSVTAAKMMDKFLAIPTAYDRVRKVAIEVLHREDGKLLPNEVELSRLELAALCALASIAIAAIDERKGLTGNN